MKGNYTALPISITSTSPSFFPIYTDQAGEVSFNETSFSVFGPAGKYKIEYVCDGISVFGDSITIVSSVNKLMFATQPPSFFSLENMDLESQFIPVVRIMDKDSKKRTRMEGGSGKKEKEMRITVERKNFR